MRIGRVGEVVDLKQKRVKLTPKQQHFCELLVYGLDDDGKPLSQSEAYRRSYSTKGSDKVVWVESCKLAANPKVAAMINRLRQQREVATQASGLSERDYIFKHLRAIIEDENEASASRVKSLELLGKHHSLWTDTVQVKQTNADELKQQLATRLDDLLADGTGGN